MKKLMVCLFICTILLGTIDVIIYYRGDRTSNFNFIIKYNVGGRSVLNTYDNTYTREGAPFITMKLNKAEIDEIFNEMQKIDIFNYAESFPKYVAPSTKSEFYLEVTYKKQKKVIVWSSDNIPPFSIDTKTGKVTFKDEYKDNDILKLQKMISKIVKIVEHKPEYKKLPKPTRMYAINK